MDAPSHENGNDWTGKIARHTSDLLNPFFIPLLVFVALGWLIPVANPGYYWLVGVSAVFYTAIPLSITILHFRWGKIESLDLPIRRKRYMLFIYAILSSSAGSVILIFLFMTGYPFIAMVASVFILNTIIGYILNLKWKVSIHSASVASAGVILLMLWLADPDITFIWTGILSLSVLLLLLPLMMWSRYRLKVHTAGEIFGGAAAGIFFTCIELGSLVIIF